ncbi:helix-turn-helix transcriptional regulator [Klebsiella oxytoca]
MVDSIVRSEPHVLPDVSLQTIPMIPEAKIKHMTRTQRLLELIQILRSHRYPVTAVFLSQELNVSVRSVYRDITTLTQQGAEIEGSAGIGYKLKSDFNIPPLMFNKNEVDALILGLNWVMQNTNEELNTAANNVMAKIHSVLPEYLANEIDNHSLLISSDFDHRHHNYLNEIRKAITSRNIVRINYADKNDVITSRDIWPVALGFFDTSRMLAGWCELRQTFRSFRLDRIKELTVTERRYPQTRQKLLKDWKEHESIPQKKTY